MKLRVGVEGRFCTTVCVKVCVNICTETNEFLNLY
jgi:hypothetical protein